MYFKVLAIKYNLKNTMLVLSKPVAIFIASRVIVVMGILFSNYLPHNPGLPEDQFHSIVTPFINRWDARWYMGIAETGYPILDGKMPVSVQFFPFYPLASAIIHKALGMPIYWGMFIVSNLSFLLAIIILYIYVKENFNGDYATWTIIFLCFIPTSVFFSAGYTESLALLLITASFYCMQKERFLIAAIFVGLATATRFTMIALASTFLWVLLSNRGKFRNWIAIIPIIVLSVGGLALYMLFLWYRFSDPFAFGNVLGHWQTRHYTFFDFILIKEILSFINHGKVYGFNTIIPLIFGVIVFVVFLISSIYGLIRFKQPLFLFALALLLLSYYGVASKMGLVGIGRYSVLAFPALIPIAGLNNTTKTIILAILASLLPLYAALFAKWYWIG